MAWVIVTLLAMILISLWLFLYQLLKQQGRVLLRLNNLEERLEYADDDTRGMPFSSVQPRDAPIGSILPPFRLSDLDRKVVALEDLRGKRALLVHWDPRCGFCDLIAPDLAAIQGELSRSSVNLLLLSRGDAEVNRKMADEHGLKCPILLQEPSATVEAFQNRGTPSAYLLDEQGRIAKSLAVGYDQVLSLIYEAVAVKKRLPGERPLQASRIERKGLKAGTLAPDFSLPDIYGRFVSLSEFRGRRVLLVFSDPHCGPCNQLGPRLVHLYRTRRKDLAIIMVGRGDPEENRRKAAEYGIEFPVVVQDKWKLSKEYGIFSMPVAFLISEEGLIEQAVAIGADAILALADKGEAVSVRS